MKGKEYLLIIIYLLLILLTGLAVKPTVEVLVDSDINKINLKFYPGYNIATAEAINEINKNGNYIDEINIEVVDEDFDKLSSLIKGLKPTTFDFSTCDCAYIMDDYEIIINDNQVLSLGDEFGSNGEFTFDVSEEFNTLIKNIISKSDNDIYSNFVANEVTISADGNEITLTEDEINRLLDNRYFTVNNDEEDYENYDGGYKYIIKVDNEIEYYLYDSDMAYLKDKDRSTYVMFSHFYNDVESILNNRRMDLDNKLNTDRIIIEKDGEQQVITDEEKVNELIEAFKLLKYSSPNYIKDYTSSNFKESDTKIIVNECTYVIPSEEYIANRYFIDTDGTVYDVSCNEFNTVMKLIK